MTLAAKWFPGKAPFGLYREARCGLRGCCPILVLIEPERVGRALGRGVVEEGGVWKLSPRVQAKWRDYAARNGNWRDFYAGLWEEGWEPRHGAARHREYIGNVAVALPATIKCPQCGQLNEVPLFSSAPPLAARSTDVAN